MSISKKKSDLYGEIENWPKMEDGVRITSGGSYRGSSGGSRSGKGAAYTGMGGARTGSLKKRCHTSAMGNFKRIGREHRAKRKKKQSPRSKSIDQDRRAVPRRVSKRWNKAN